MGVSHCAILVLLITSVRAMLVADDGFTKKQTNFSQPSDPPPAVRGRHDASLHVRWSPCEGRQGMADFHCLYVSNTGALVWNRGKAGTRFEMAGSPNVSSSSLLAAARTVSKMVRFMSRDIFSRLARYGNAGIFTMAEKLTVFPEFLRQRNGNCGTSCAGECRSTCTFDGRKWDDIYGAGGSRAVVLDHNVVCGPSDPYSHRTNILIHEMGHLVHRKAMDPGQRRLVSKAYARARDNGTWDSDSYAMATEGEYFATATSAFFNANRDFGGSSGGMNLCGAGHQVCEGEAEARAYLRKKDPSLAAVLVQVFNDNQEDLLSGLGVCPS